MSGLWRRSLGWRFWRTQCTISFLSPIPLSHLFNRNIPGHWHTSHQHRTAQPVAARPEPPRRRTSASRLGSRRADRRGQRGKPTWCKRSGIPSQRPSARRCSSIQWPGTTQLREKTSCCWDVTEVDVAHFAGLGKPRLNLVT